MEEERLREVGERDLKRMEGRRFREYGVREIVRGWRAED